jgi:hypothetical protein
MYVIRFHILTTIVAVLGTHLLVQHSTFLKIYYRAAQVKNNSTKITKVFLEKKSFPK